jgi:hypothetical protein
VLGLFLALALLTKTTTLGLIGIAFLGVLHVAWRERGGSVIAFRALLANGIAMAVPIVVLNAWYFVRNQIEYGDPMAYRLINASALPPRDAPLTTAELFQINLPWLWQTFWGGPTPGDLPQVLTNLLFVTFVAAVIGFALYLVREWSALGADRLVMIGLMLGWLSFIFAAQLQFIRTASGTDQGRYLFPAISTIGLMIALGWSEIVWRISVLVRRGMEFVTAERSVAIVSTAFFIALPAFVLVTYTLPAYAQPAPVEPAAIDQRGARVEAAFENGMQLRGHSLSSRALNCADKLGVTLYWTTELQVNETYRVFAHLVNEQGTVGGNKDVIPGGGAYPTVYWKPGEYLEDTIQVPWNRGAKAGKYNVIVGVYPFGQPDHRLNLKDSELDFVTVGDVQLNAPPEGCP